jgi:hypothetical protein
MLEEFATSLASSRFVVGASFERLVSPPVAPLLQDEDPTVVSTLLEDEDPAVVDSCALRAPLHAPFNGRWALRWQLALPVHRRWTPPRVRSATTPPNADSTTSSAR